MSDVDTLVDAMHSVIRDLVSGNSVAVAFSGGLDSGIVATIAKEYANITLYTVGLENSYDVNSAREASKALGLPWVHICISESEIERELPNMIKVAETVNPITLSFEVPLYFVAKNCMEALIIGGQGADELFAGYSKYIGLSESDFRGAMEDDMAKLLNETLKHESLLTGHFGKKVVYPYLDRRVTSVIDRMGITNMELGEIRKPVLRDVANAIGQPELALKPKKAAQYGSGTMNTMRSIAKKKGMTVREMIMEMAGM